MKKPVKIRITTLAMINVAAIISLRNFPLTAEYGLQLVFYILLASLVFFIPTALVAAELATGWPKRGGIYIWIREGLGDKWGFLGIWLQWIENVIWYPIILSFAAASFAYIFSPALAQNKIFMMAMILCSFWLFTAINCKGMRASGFISSFGAVVGTLIPGILIIILGIAWLIDGGRSAVVFSWDQLIPNLANQNNIVFFNGILLGLAGMEMSAVHAEDVENPQKNYPRAILLSTLMIIILSILGSLAIATVIPREQIDLVSGVMQTFSRFFASYRIGRITPVIAALTTIGALAMVSTWIIGPSKGLLATAKHGDLPPMLGKTNKKGAPWVIMMIQGIIISGLSLVFLFMPTVSSSYWILSALTAQLYLIMYILMFIAALRLRYIQPDVKRTYRVPGGLLGMWIVTTIGILAALFAIGAGFIPPQIMDTGNLVFYESFLIIGIIFMCLVPLCISFFKKEAWQDQDKREDRGS